MKNEEKKNSRGKNNSLWWKTWHFHRHGRNANVPTTIKSMKPSTFFSWFTRLNCENQYCVLDDESVRKGKKEKKDARFKHDILQQQKKCNGIFFSVAGFYCEWNFFLSIFVVVVSDDTVIVVALQIRRVSTLWLKSEQKCHAYISVENLLNGFLFIVRDMCGTLTNCDCDCVLLSVSRVICVWIVPFMKWKIFEKK